MRFETFREQKQKRKQGEYIAGVVRRGTRGRVIPIAHARLEPRPVASDHSLSCRGLFAYVVEQSRFTPRSVKQSALARNAPGSVRLAILERGAFRSSRNHLLVAHQLHVCQRFTWHIHILVICKINEINSQFDLTCRCVLPYIQKRSTTARRSSTVYDSRMTRILESM